MEDDQLKDRIAQLISTTEDSKLDRMLNILHTASDNSEKIDDEN